MSKISERRRFCAICGVTDEVLLDNLCEKCYKKEHPLEVELLKKLTVEICINCGDLRVLNTRIDPWAREESLEEVIREVVRSAVLSKFHSEDPYDVEFEDDIENDKIMNYGVKSFELRTKIILQPHEEFSPFEKDFSTRLKMSRTICNDCSMIKSGYFEAILQIRADKRKLTDDELDELENLINDMMKQYEDAKLSYILKMEVEPEGITAQVSTKILASNLAREIRVQTAGKLSLAYEHKTTSKDGSEVYTNTYLVRLPAIGRGDIINFEKEIWRVKAINDDQFRLESLTNHEERKVVRKRVEISAKKRNDELVPREYMLVSIDGQIVVIMGMDNYENFDDNLERLPKNRKIGETIKGFLLDEKNYYLE
ncbi:MAG: NMD3-related protein [Candidatus Heimdallarchaeaceae archaeon]